MSQVNDGPCPACNGAKEHLVGWTRRFRCRCCNGTGTSPAPDQLLAQLAPAELTALAQRSANHETNRLIMSRLRGLGLVRVAGHDGERFPLTALGDQVSLLASA